MSRVTEYTEDDERPSRGEESSEKEEGRSLHLPKLSPIERLRQFYHDVKLEMRKTSWPTRNEVWSTTLVVLIAVVFFGFYLWGIDLLITLGFDSLEKTVR